MRINFEDGSSANITLSDSAVRDPLIRYFKHLQNINLPFRDRDWPFFLHETTFESQVEQLAMFAKKVSIDLDQQRCLELDQQYFNFLHSVFEKKYNGNPDWVDFHETIHILESFFSDQPEHLNYLGISYRELAGPLEIKFDRKWMTESVTQVKTGQVYFHWSELSKHPWQYWLDQEPNDIKRICELCKPWLHLRPTLRIAFSDKDLLAESTLKLADFQSWWSRFEADWCRYWNLDNWNWKEMFSVIPVGWVDSMDTLISASATKVRPCRVRLNSQSEHVEVLNFEIDIEAIWHTHPPCLDLLIDNQSIRVPDLDLGHNHVVFEATLEPGHHTLEMRRSGATDLDRSQRLIINSVRIDQLDCGQLILADSVFLPEYPEPWATQQRDLDRELLKEIPFETVLGHNGIWRMNFSSPFYPYFLQIHSQPLHISQ